MRKLKLLLFFITISVFSNAQTKTNKSGVNKTGNSDEKLTSLVYVKVANAKAKTLFAKLSKGSIFINTASVNINSKPKWSLLFKYDSLSLIDLNNVKSMEYLGDVFKVITGSYVASKENKGFENTQYNSNNSERKFIYSKGFEFKNDFIAFAQFSGEQKFVIEKSQNSRIYFVKAPSNFIYESDYEDILKNEPNITFEITNSNSNRFDFALIFFFMKYVKSDI